MKFPHLVHDLVRLAAETHSLRRALTHRNDSITYNDLFTSTERFCSGLIDLGADRSERIAIYLEKRFEAVITCFGATMAGCVFVPINPLLKPNQVAHILRDCNVGVLVTSPERLSSLSSVLADCTDLKSIVVTGSTPKTIDTPKPIYTWSEILEAPKRSGHRVIDADMAAILYTSGSTGNPKGVVLSHRNMVAGAISVASYLENTSDDTLLAALPLSFDAGFSQLTTAFHTGARVVLLNYLMPRDVIKALEHEQVTGLTAVPPLFIQLSAIKWPDQIAEHLRYIANTGGRLPREILDSLRRRLPKTKTFLMYGLTEAFRSTYLPPSEIDQRPDSIGKAIPNAEVLVLREDGSPCAPNEPGELVHRGTLVSMGYWNDPVKTAERFKPLPKNVGGRSQEFAPPELAVFSGDTVRMDEEGFIYFIGRNDEMIKTSGYRISPTEIEEIIYDTGLVAECAAFGIDHPTLGQAIHVVVTPPIGHDITPSALLSECRNRMPTYMVPAHIEVRSTPLPRNANGKIDRKILSSRHNDSES